MLVQAFAIESASSSPTDYLCDEIDYDNDIHNHSRYNRRSGKGCDNSLIMNLTQQQLPPPSTSRRHPPRGDKRRRRQRRPCHPHDLYLRLVSLGNPLTFTHLGGLAEE